MTRQVPLATPGEILAQDWLGPMGLSQYALARAIDVPPRRINEIVLGKRAITVDTALRLGAFFGVMLPQRHDIRRRRAPTDVMPLLNARRRPACRPLARGRSLRLRCASR